MSYEYDEQLSFLQKPNKDEIDPENQKIFDANVEKMEKNWGFINNLFKILPLNDKQYIAFLNFKNSLFDEETTYLSRIDKEMIGLVVSSTNGCAYCLSTHGYILRGLTKDPEWVDELTYNYRIAKLTDKQRALCDFAYFLTTKPREIDKTQIEKLRAVGFNDHEILEASYVVGFFNYTNRWTAAIGAKPNAGHFDHNRSFNK
ncbi:MAG: peroxidase-related enzyme [Intestinibacter sp.]|uniref:peroxidase-related enzyme n=1 Tax=Intestinibacter sp. TaxID=1965304 RepID=UPI002A81EA06|nr:peroxidase-related enzyme [Intestinibacter sp.]MDY4575473.1 peroxidase-related enzyme [Intestinibacter sp.]